MRKTSGLVSRHTAAALLLALLALAGADAARFGTAHHALADATVTSADVTAPDNTLGPS